MLDTVNRAFLGTERFRAHVTDEDRRECSDGIRRCKSRCAAGCGMVCAAEKQDELDVGGNGSRRDWLGDGMQPGRVWQAAGE
jgi:hypothetical protein